MTRPSIFLAVPSPYLCQLDANIRNTAIILVEDTAPNRSNRAFVNRENQTTTEAIGSCRL